MPGTASDEPDTEHAHRKKEERRIAIGEPVVLFLIALAARLPHLDHVPFKDELNHVLAARSLLETGTFEILPGAEPYERAWAFTYLVAGMFRWFGESLVVGRLPSVIAACLLVVLLFVWLRSEGARAAAWIAALLLAFSPVSLTLSQWVRFYTIHALLFFVAALAIYRLVSGPSLERTHRALLGLIAGLSLFVALHLQFITLVGVAGLSLWLMVAWLLPRWRGLPTRRLRLATAACAAAVPVAAFAVFWSTGMVARLIRISTTVPGWASDRTDNVRFYHAILLEQYPTLWTLTPLAFLIAVAYRRRAALLCGCVFGVAFIAHSLLAWKAERYLFYALPMLFAIWGLAISGALPWLRDRIGTALDSLVPAMQSNRARRAVVTGLLLAVALFSAFGSASTSYTVKYLTVDDANWRGWGGYRANSDWEAAGARLHDELQRSEVLLASYDVTAVYALGGLDYLIRHLDLPRGEHGDFMPRGKTPAAVVATPDALRLVMACHASGVALIENSHWRRRWGTSPEVADHLEASSTRIELPAGWRLHAFHWEREPSTQDAAACVEIRARREQWATTPGS